MYLIKFVYSVLLFPPGIIIICLLGMAYWCRRQSRVTARLIFVLALALYFFSTGLLAQAVVHSLEVRHIPPKNVTGDVIVVLGGGATLDTPNVDGLGHLAGSAANRLLTAVQLYHKLGVPIIVSGGQVYVNTGREADIARNILLGVGVPDSKIIVEDASLNTTQNAQNCATILAQQGLKQPILVTSAFHMERSVLQFRKAGVEVVPFPTDYLTEMANNITARDFWPTAYSLDILTTGLKEYMGIAAINFY